MSLKEIGSWRKLIVGLLTEMWPTSDTDIINSSNTIAKVAQTKQTQSEEKGTKDDIISVSKYVRTITWKRFKTFLCHPSKNGSHEALGNLIKLDNYVNCLRSKVLQNWHE
jgi:hypothetical protein